NSSSKKDKFVSKIFSKFREKCPFVAHLDSEYSLYKFCSNRFILKKRSDDSSFYWCPPTNFWNCLYDLPYGYELGLNQDGMIYFIDFLRKSKVFYLSSLSDLGWIIRKCENGIAVEAILPDSPFSKKIIPEDIIKSINDVPITREKDIQSLIKKNGSNTFCIKRSSNKFQDSFAVNNKIKSCLKSIEQKECSQKFPNRVHFSEAPIIINYKNQESNLWGSTTNHEKIFEIVAQVLKPLKLSFNHCFTLALLHRGSTDIEYFSLNDLLYSLVLKKQATNQTECFLVIYSHPQNPEDWADPKYALLVDFLFQQFRLFLLTARFRSIFSISISNLHQLLALGTTVDFLNIRNRVQLPSKDSSDDDKSNINSNDALPKNESGCKKHKEIRLSSFFLEQHKVDTPHSTIFDLRPDLNSSHIISFMISSFDLITPNDLKIFYLADKNVQKTFNVTHEKVEQKIFVILQKAQICFIKACLECKVFPAARYRVVVRHNRQTSNDQEDIRISPKTLAVTLNSLDFHSENETIFIMSFDDIAGIVASSIDSENASVTIFSVTKNHLSIKLQSYHLPSLLLMLSARCNELWHDILKIKVPLFDLTNLEYRCPTDRIPGYDHVHLVIPSSWSYDYLQCKNFFKTLKNINNDQIEKFYDDFTMFFMHFERTTVEK
ncbi:hypothetical protein MXB_2967, partial [Myxobolus squamalis]